MELANRSLILATIVNILKNLYEKKRKGRMNRLGRE